MADSRRELILQAAAAALGAAGKPATLTVNRSRRPPDGPTGLPTASVWAGRPGGALDEEVTHQAKALLGKVQREFYFTVALRRAVATAAPDQDLDLYSQWVVASVAALAEVGGIRIAVLEAGSKWVYAEAPDFEYLELLTIFRADYPTLRADLTQ